MNNKITINFEEYKELQKIAIESTKIVDLEEAYKKEKYLVDKLTRQLTDEYKNTEYQCKEKERLNNIINGMEKFFKYELEEEVRPLNDFKVSVWTICLDKLKELKEKHR